MSGNVMKTRRPEPAEVEYKQMRFLIMDRPTDATIDRFIEVCVVQWLVDLFFNSFTPGVPFMGHRQTK